MRSYEIQVYKGWKWEFDSYFEDRYSAMADADELVADARIQGVRVLKENYDETSNIAVCDVIFTRMRNKNAGPDLKRKPAPRNNRSKNRSTSQNGIGHRRSRHRKPRKKLAGPVFLLTLIAIFFLLGGISTIVVLGGFSVLP